MHQYTHGMSYSMYKYGLPNKGAWNNLQYSHKNGIQKNE